MKDLITAVKLYTTKYIHYIIYTTLIIAALLIYNNISSVYKAKLQQKDSVIREQQDTITYTKNKLGQEVAYKTAAITDLATARLSYASELSKIQKQLGIKERQIKAFTEVQTVNHGQGIGTAQSTPISDSTGLQQEITVSDSTEWFVIRGKIYKTEFKYEYTVRDELTFVTSQDKTSVRISVLSGNPNVHVTNLRNVTIEKTREKAKRFGIGPYVGIDIKGKYSVGVSVNYDIIQF